MAGNRDEWANIFKLMHYAYAFQNYAAQDLKHNE